MSDQPEWARKRQVFWDDEGRAHPLPTWPPTRQVSTVEPPRKTHQLFLAGTQIEGVQAPTVPKETKLPNPLILYYVDAPEHDERWVPFSPVLVEVLTQLAAQQGVTFEWRVMPPTVSAERVMRRE
jgi:hypothetical protein